MARRPTNEQILAELRKRSPRRKLEALARGIWGEVREEYWRVAAKATKQELLARAHSLDSGYWEQWLIGAFQVAAIPAEEAAAEAIQSQIQAEQKLAAAKADVKRLSAELDELKKKEDEEVEAA